MADIFLSYNREDQDKAKTVADALQAEGFVVWWDTVLRAGETYDEVTEGRLRAAKAVVVLWSPRSVKSKWVRAEATLGDRKAALVPAMIETCDRPVMFELIQTADLTHWAGDRRDPQWRSFIEDIRTKVRLHDGVPSAAAAKPVATPAPRGGAGAGWLAGALAVAAAVAGGAYLVWSGMIEIPQGGAPTGTGAPPAAAGTFQDCPTCPQMVRLPGGSFQMGSPDDEAGRNGWEGPQHAVTVAAFAIGRSEVTFAEWEACVADGGCRGYTPGDRGWGTGAQPVISVSFDDAQAYVRWLSGKTGKAYRLPSEAEWEYAARGGTTGPYWWGPRFAADHVARGQPVAAGTLQANPFGLTEMLGNLREWVEDCYVNSYAEAPADGRAVTQGNCTLRVVRDGSFKDAPAEHRAANRARNDRGLRDSAIGFRVALSL